MGDLTTQTIEFPAPAELINANHRKHWAKKAAQTKAWRYTASAHAMHAKIQPVEHARVTVWISWPDNRRRDPANYAGTAKAIVDGLTDAKVWPDDDDKHVTGPDMRRGPLSTDSRVWVRVEIEGGL